MVEEKTYLKSMLAGESRAYGFTIAFWGSGVILINIYGVPGLAQAMLYGMGAVTGFGILALAVFKNSSREINDNGSSYLALGMVHYLASLLPIAISYLISSNTSAPWAFFLSGFTVSTTYNILAVLEEDIVEKLDNFIP